MNLFVHLSIAYRTYQKARKKTDFRFVLPVFLIGSILPDLDHRMSKIPHDIDTSLPLVKNVVTKISSQFCENTILERMSKSLQMGIFCHFISDYFCDAHTHRFTGSLFQHHVYEFKMMWYGQKSKRYAIHKNALQINSFEGIYAFLERAQVLYLSDQADCITDLTYAMNCASILIESLAKKYLQSRQNTLEINDPKSKKVAAFTADSATPYL